MGKLCSSSFKCLIQCVSTKNGEAHAQLVSDSTLKDWQAPSRNQTFAKTNEWHAKGKLKKYVPITHEMFLHRRLFSFTESI